MPVSTFINFLKPAVYVFDFDNSILRLQCFKLYYGYTVGDIKMFPYQTVFGVYVLQPFFDCTINVPFHRTFATRT